MILLHASEVLVTFEDDSILHVLLDPVVLDQGVCSQPILRLNMNTKVITLPNLVHYNIGVATDGIDAYFALDELAQLDLGFVASLYFDSRTIHVSNIASENLGLGIHTLKVKSD